MYHGQNHGGVKRDKKRNTTGIQDHYLLDEMRYISPSYPRNILLRFACLLGNLHVECENSGEIIFFHRVNNTFSTKGVERIKRIR